MVLRKAFDKFILDSVEISSSATSTVPAATAVVAASQQSSGTSSHGGAAMNAIASALHLKLSALENKRNNLDSTDDSNRDEGASNSLMKRARDAEERVASLKRELAELRNSRGGDSGAKGGAGAAAGGGSSAADQAEIKKLQKRIKELEASGGGGGGNAASTAAAEKKAVAAAEKNFAKKIKDMETAARKEKGAVEQRAAAAEKQLEETTAALQTVTTERDSLKIKVRELSNLSSEMEALRDKAMKADELTAVVATKDVEIATLTEQYKKEGALRKKYKNELEDLKGAIRVYARCRPMARYELDRNCQQIVRFVDETSMKIATSRGEKEFEFDAAFPSESTQEQVFEDTRRLIESFLDGFNVCLFAYGQTGSGKTFTMTGSPTMPGLTPKSITEMFRLIGERRHCTTRVTTYFVELYNDNLVVRFAYLLYNIIFSFHVIINLNTKNYPVYAQDLYWILDNKKSRAEPPKLDIKMDAKKMVYIKNVVIKDASSPDELMDLFNKGNKERHTGATNMNAESSRSHSIFAIMAETFDNTTKKTTYGKLSLVDLAGSERADKTGASAERLKEAQNINKSLSALGDVISALSEGEKFIPYRNNKLTQLMQDSLGGNAKTLMFVNFSPADYNADETVTSLNYAARVKKITNNAAKVKDIRRHIKIYYTFEEHYSNYFLQHLQQAESEEVARLKAIIRKLQSGQAVDNIEAAVAESADAGQDAAAMAAYEESRRRREEEDRIAFGEDGATA